MSEPDHTHLLSVHFCKISCSEHQNRLIKTHHTTYDYDFSRVAENITDYCPTMTVSVTYDAGQAKFTNIHMPGFPSRTVEQDVLWRLQRSRTGIHIFKSSVHVFVSGWDYGVFKWLCIPSVHPIPYSVYATFQLALMMCPSNASLEAMCQFYQPYADKMIRVLLHKKVIDGTLTYVKYRDLSSAVFQFLVQNGGTITPSSILSMSEKEFDKCVHDYSVLAELTDELTRCVIED